MIYSIQMANSFQELPVELKIKCLSFLPPKTLLIIAGVSKDFKRLADDVSLWRHLAEKMNIDLSLDVSVKEKVVNITKRIFLFLKDAKSEKLDKARLKADPFCIWPSSKWSSDILRELVMNHPQEKDLGFLFFHADPKKRSFFLKHSESQFKPETLGLMIQQDEKYNDDIMNTFIPMDDKVIDFSQYQCLIKRYKNPLSDDENPPKKRKTDE